MNELSAKDVYKSLETSYMEITKQYIFLNEGNLQERMMHHPSIFAFFGAVLALAKYEEERAEVEFEKREAEIREARREEIVSSGKRATDRALDAYLKTVPELRTLVKIASRKTYLFNLAKNIMSALASQKDMIVQLSANRRAEAKLIEQN
jgi:hypothetical protein